MKYEARGIQVLLQRSGCKFTVDFTLPFSGYLFVGHRLFFFLLVEGASAEHVSDS